MSDIHNSNDEDPPYIQPSADLIAFKALIEQNGLDNYQSNHINAAFDLLTQVLYMLYKTTSFSTLVRKSDHVNEAERFCEAVKKAGADAQWKPTTIRATFSTLKRILQQTTIKPSFIAKLTLSQTTVKPRNDVHHYLPSQYKKMPNDHPSKLRVIKWGEAIKINTNNKSVNSLRGIVYFIVHSCLPRLNFDIECFDDDADYSTVTAAELNALHDDNLKKLNYVKIFAQHILRLDITKYNLALSAKVTTRTREDAINDNSTDKHRVSVDELEKIYKESQKNTRNELMYLMMVTTGMRVGGLVNIKTEHVATVTNIDVVVLDTGRTLEKGSKWFSFRMNQRVKKLVKLWLISARPASGSPYLFPGRGGCTGHISTGGVRQVFKNMCTQAGLAGPHLHPHAIRHSFAHILLESGNSVDVVSKLMGHSNSSTTEHFYLKESAAEVASRANIPWLKSHDEQKKKVVPDFLRDDTQSERVKQKQVRKRMKHLNRASMFNDFNNRQTEHAALETTSL